MKRFLLLLLVAISAQQAHAQYASFPELAINLSLPEYMNLKLDGGVKELNEPGIRGLIIYRVDASTYLVYDRNCSYHPYDLQCSTVDADLSRLFMKDTCCGSMFSFADGQPTKGPASRPLIRYRTELAGTILKITDEIVN